jgi:hypothetical protein
VTLARFATATLSRVARSNAVVARCAKRAASVAASEICIETPAACQSNVVETCTRGGLGKRSAARRVRPYRRRPAAGAAVSPAPPDTGGGRSAMVTDTEGNIGSMTSPPSPRRMVPPAVPPVTERRTVAYTPPKFVPPPRMERWQRNLLVWGICAIIIVAAVVLFVNLMLPEEMRRLLEPYVAK